jgi:hypothetical protein
MADSSQARSRSSPAAILQPATLKGEVLRRSLIAIDTRRPNGLRRMEGRIESEQA